MARLCALLPCLLPWYCTLCTAAGSQTPADGHHSGKLRDYVVTVPCSTDFRGRFLSHVVSAPTAATSHSHLRVARSPPRLERETLRPGGPRYHFLYFNVTVFGKLLHLLLQPNRRLVAPGAPVEWHEDFRELFRQPLQQECVYTGGVTGMPGAAVAISNCDGLAGLIRTDSSDYFIEPLERGQQEKEAGGRTHVVYRREAIQQEWAEPHGDLHNEAFGLGDLPNVLDLVGDQLGDTERKRRHARPGSYSIEVLLAVDDSVVRFHGKEHTQNYVLTLMNIVDEIYHDESLGAHVNIALVRLIIVGYRQSLSLIERGNPARSLEQVCRWAHSQQRQDPNHTEHHDHVIFLTRQNFGPSGYAPVTGMCHPLRSCALNHEDGFSSAFVVAHETGHVLGMEHDGQGNGCDDETSLGSVMAPLVQAAFHRFHWSRCSKLELSRYLPSYDCLLDDPFERTWPQPPELPGIDYSMDEQCRFDFGTGYHTCLAFRTFEPCKQLWCSHPDNPYFCKTKKGPPLDGTDCAPGKWCFKGHCIWKSPEQTYGQDGGWSSWTKFGSCSRSCGGGVRSRSRSCDNPPPAYGGRPCSGSMFEYQICNSDDCPGPYEDFRAQQCAKRNSYYIHQNAKHSWLPYEPEDAALKQVQIPAGARHIQIELLEKMPHRIAVKNHVTGSFILNPKGKEASSRTFTALGLEWEHAAEETKDSLKTSGPLPEAIAVLVLPPVEGKPRGSLAYKYVIHEDLLPLIGSNNVLLEETDIYEWALKSWSPCSKACGGGIQFTKYGCRRRRDHHMVQRHLCDHKKRPKPIRRRCNQHPCPQPMWVTEEWGACSRSCGKLGLQTRGVQCLLPLSNGTRKAMPAKACLGNRPEAKRPCLRVPCPAQWRTGAWSQCSATCGEGIQQRQVVCRNSSNALGQCEGVKPDTVQVCSLPACGGGLQNSTVKATVQDPVTKVGHQEPQSRPLTPTNLTSTTEPCVGDRSIFCRMKVLDRYCSIPGYHRLCCESCTSGPSANVTSLPTVSTPGSLLPEPKATQEDVESSKGPTRVEDHRQSHPTQVPRLVDRISSGTQHPFTPQMLSPTTFEGNSSATPPPSGWTQTAMTASEDQGPSREEAGHGSTSLPATSPVT
ncbi:A disintegrin and metalloproteinase with thrombospondin motifs 14 [Microtus ochrogaster]|uniref:A disintegrin and metalloproteinase with thrombospondin motifs 14 n=1 Tax=Microtus ochrogaster TaxID=79684 RepID=A0A8J6GTT6_MICOH|nr:A disintegrin and metalloproteinase with thrombospondin motifs 14 [Microtus ochrogaster]